MAAAPSGIVFDFDGVLFKSMELHAESYRRILTPYGIEPTDRDIFLQEGARSETIIRDALRTLGEPVDESLVNRLSDDKQKVFRGLGPPQAYEGARELLKVAQALTPDLALVTGTRRDNLERLIPDLLPVFRCVLAQDSYTHDKPHPEPYAKAAKALGFEPAALVVVENAVRGVESAKAAGYGTVIGITTTLTKADLAHADHVVTRHDEAADLLRRLFDAAR